jgi:putative membrane protein
MIQDNAASPVAQGDRRMLKLLLHWILSAIALLIVSRLVPGFVVQGIGPALIAALVIGLLNATLGFLLKIVTFPLTVLTLGLFLLVINGLMILVASGVVPGFKVYGMVPAFWGAVVLAILGVLFRYILKDSKDYPRSRARNR